MEIYLVYVMGGDIVGAYTKYSSALEYVLKTIEDLTGEPYTGSTEEELNEYLDDNVDVACFEAIELYTY